MKKKNGFISISVIYSFFVVFMLLLLIILNSYINNRASFDIYKSHIKNKVSETKSELGKALYLNETIIKASTTSHPSSSSYATKSWYLLKETISGGVNYYYKGTTPNNYVCFGDENDNCALSSKHLYQIIGVFDNKTHGKSGNLVKLIKVDALPDKYRFSSSTSSNIYGSVPNEISAKLNGPEYLENSEYFDEKSRKMIEPIKWKIGNSSSYNINSTGVYNSERSGETTASELAIGLPYVSDYGLTTGQYGECKPYTDYLGYFHSPGKYCYNYSWLVSHDMWFINPYYTSSQPTYFAYYLDDGDNAKAYNVTYSKNVRPSFYLKSNAIIVSGTGERYNPYILNIQTSEE